MMGIENRIRRDSARNDLFRLKKAVQFIRAVLCDFREYSFGSLSFALVLAISKANEFKDQIDMFCPAREAFLDLAQILKSVPHNRESIVLAEQKIDQINACFELDQIKFLRR